MATEVSVTWRKGKEIYLEGWKKNAVMPVLIIFGGILTVLALAFGVLAFLSPIIAVAAIIFGIVQLVEHGFTLLGIIPLVLGIIYLAFCRFRINV